MTARAAACALVLGCACGSLEIGSYGEQSLTGSGGQTTAGAASSTAGAGGRGAAAGTSAEAGKAGAIGSGGAPIGGGAGDASGATEAGAAGDGGDGGDGGDADPVRVVELETGNYHNCARLSDGSVRCWGVEWGASGTLGLARGPDKHVVGDDETPASVGNVQIGGRVTQLSAGDGATCALLDTGKVRCWGSNLGNLGYGNLEPIGDDELPFFAGDVDVGGTVIQISTGGIRTCALLDTGNVRCWGHGIFGTLGYGNTSNIGDDETPASAGDVDVGGAVAQISAGMSHVCAVLVTGALRCWGDGFNGALGYGNTDSIGDNETPASAGDVDVGGAVKEVACSNNATCALLIDGTVRCWGRRAPYQLGAPYPIGDDETPASVPPLDLGGKAVSISVSAERACAVLENGGARCWGDGQFRPLGYGRLQHIGDDETPASAGDLKLGGPVARIGVGPEHLCALLQNGAVRCWGGSVITTPGTNPLANVPIGVPFVTELMGDNEFPDRFEPVQVLDEPYQCQADCDQPRCGDGNVDADLGEECDDGVASETCDANCTFSSCGDWTLNQAANEVCDFGGVDQFECDFDCSEARCGDGHTNPQKFEECDDGNQNDGDGCGGYCTLP